MSTPEPVTSGKTEVPPGALVSELERIRREAAEVDAQKDISLDGEVAPRVRSTLCNLIIVSFPGEFSVSSMEIENLITDLCVSRPSRFFIVGYDRDSGDDAKQLRTAASSRCVLANSGAHVCSEEVYVSASNSSLEFVPNLLLSLLVPDIDVVLLVLGDPMQGPVRGAGREASDDGFHVLLRELSDFSDVVVYDSSNLSDYETGVDLLGGDSALSLAAKDLNWIRTRRWRSLIAEQFDNPCAAKNVQSIKRLSFNCLATKEEFEQGLLPADALLLCSWILSRVAPDVDASALQKKESDSTVIQVGVSPSIELEFKRFGDPGQQYPELSCQGLTIDMVSEADRCTIEIRKDFLLQTAELSTEVCGSDNTCNSFTRRVPFPNDSRNELILEGIDTHGEDTQFNQTRVISQQLAALLKS